MVMKTQLGSERAAQKAAETLVAKLYVKVSLCRRRICIFRSEMVKKELIFTFCKAQSFYINILF